MPHGALANKVSLPQRKHLTEVLAGLLSGADGNGPVEAETYEYKGQTATRYRIRPS